MKLKAGHSFFIACIFVFCEYVLVSYRSVSRLPRHFDVIFHGCDEAEIAPLTAWEIVDF